MPRPAAGTEKADTGEGGTAGRHRACRPGSMRRHRRDITTTDATTDGDSAATDPAAGASTARTPTPTVRPPAPQTTAHRDHRRRDHRHRNGNGTTGTGHGNPPTTGTYRHRYDRPPTTGTGTTDSTAPGTANTGPTAGHQGTADTGTANTGTANTGTAPAGDTGSDAPAPGPVLAAETPDTARSTGTPGDVAPGAAAVQSTARRGRHLSPTAPPPPPADEPARVLGAPAQAADAAAPVDTEIDEATPDPTGDKPDAAPVVAEGSAPAVPASDTAEGAGAVSPVQLRIVKTTRCPSR